MIVYIYNIGVDLYNGFNGLRHRINWTYFSVLDGLAHPLYSEIHARPPDCTKYRQYPVFNGPLRSGCFPLCQYSMDALYRILYQYRGCLHTTVRVLQRILSRQAGGLPFYYKTTTCRCVLKTLLSV